MNRPRWIALVSIILLTMATFGPVRGVEYSITTDGESTQVRISQSYQQNLTLIDPGFTLPTVSTFFTGGNSTVPGELVASAIRSEAPGSGVENFEMEVRSTPWSGTANAQFLNLTTNFRLTGVSQTTGDGFFLVDASWKSFKVSEDILVEGVSVNRIGERYLADVVQRVASAQQPGQFGGLQVHWEGLLVPSHAVKEVVSRIVTLDFSKLDKPLSHWDHSLDMGDVSTKFRFDLGARTVLSLTISIPEPGQEIRLLYVLLTHLEAEVMAPGLAVPNEDILSIDTGTGHQHTLMAAIIASVISVFTLCHLVERRFSVQSYRRARRSR